MTSQMDYPVRNDDVIDALFKVPDQESKTLMGDEISIPPRLHWAKFPSNRLLGCGEFEYLRLKKESCSISLEAACAAVNGDGVNGRKIMVF